MRFTPSNSEQRLRPPSYRGCWHGVSRRFLWRYRQSSIVFGYSGFSPLTVVYTPKGFLPHAASLRQSFDHCAIFPTAASRRSLGRISVPMWRIVLSDPLRVIALVSRYLTNKLIRRDPLIGREHASRGPLWSLSQEKKRHYAVLARVSPGCPSPKDRLVTCYSPVRHSAIESKLSSPRSTCMC